MLRWYRLSRRGQAMRTTGGSVPAERWPKRIAWGAITATVLYVGVKEAPYVVAVLATLAVGGLLWMMRPRHVVAIAGGWRRQAKRRISDDDPRVIVKGTVPRDGIPAVLSAGIWEIWTRHTALGADGSDIRPAEVRLVKDRQFVRMEFDLDDSWRPLLRPADRALGRVVEEVGAVGVDGASVRITVPGTRAAAVSVTTGAGDGTYWLDVVREADGTPLLAVMRFL